MESTVINRLVVCVHVREIKRLIFSSCQIHNSIKDCFVTGEWKESENAQTLLNMDNDDDLYGDFEDLETGKKFTANSKEENPDEVDEGR